ncbi:copper chaperone PCu(A)C [Mangrovicella endophytica]|uniref:copper chaperone PCu(A)C n=1 Tax=Mangrovicella endophytica TaxID=2066697 RepID=UPI000C9E9E96|nr:copper chaperone PCu(A)C [Mangrovicella endophytica]
MKTTFLIALGALSLGVALPTAALIGPSPAQAGDPQGLEHSAPLLRMSAAEDKAAAGHAHGAAAGASHQPEQVAAGAAAGQSADAIRIEGGFVRAMLPGAPVGGGYLTVINGGTADDRLLTIASPSAGQVELHDMAMDNGVMTMRRIDEAVAIPAGGSLALSPGGKHLMFMAVKQPFRVGDSVPVTLTFEKAGSLSTTLPVLAPNATAAPADGAHANH